MTKKDLEDNRLLVKSMDWDQLASDLIDLEIYLSSLKESLTKKEILSCNKLIKIYEKEKRLRITKGNKGFIPEGLLYGHDYSSSWNYEEDEY